jgi:hypothetical protein
MSKRSSATLQMRQGVYLAREKDGERDYTDNYSIKPKRDEGMLTDVIEEEFDDKRCDNKR